jgi:DMSO/TMAO reductase YedYZ molybdopterin-dependent catalytic subunit
MILSRRDLIRTAPLAALAGLSASGARGAEPLIVRMQEPRNLETPLSELFTGGTEKFFVRSHFAVPKIEAQGFKLSVGGHVEKPLELALADLKKMGEVSREMVLECAGNGRVFLAPQARGLQWGHGAVGSAKWTGVPLGAVLERAGAKRGAGDVVLVGADKGAIADPATPGAIPFDRGIPLAKAKADETLLVWEMNGEPLTPAHGAPLRAIVGGWYGMASVKWLSQIVVLDREHAGFWQTFDYSRWERPVGAPPRLVPLAAMEPKAVITSPLAGTTVPAGRELKVSGFAWAGERGVAKIEFSPDGDAWSLVQVYEKPKPFEYVKWEATFKPQAGPLKLLARATDDAGRTQPDTRDADRRTYMINHRVPVELTAK